MIDSVGVCEICRNKRTKIYAQLDMRHFLLDLFVQIDSNVGSSTMYSIKSTDYTSCDVEKCQTEGIYWQNFIWTDKKILFLLHILLFGLTRFLKSVQMTDMSKKISTTLDSQQQLQ